MDGSVKKKYFIRGFGMGVLFAAVIFGISYGMHNTDEKVMERARELGMVKEQKQDEDTLDLATPAPKEEDKKESEKGEHDTPDGTDATEGKGASDKTASSDKGSTPQPEQSSAPDETPQPTPPKEVVIQKTPKPAKDNKDKTADKTKIAVNISSGMWSDTVSMQLAQAGLVDDAEAFDKYLNKNGYASKIKTGSYFITPGMSYKEIAKIISGQ